MNSMTIILMIMLLVALLRIWRMGKRAKVFGKYEEISLKENLLVDTV